MADAMKLVPVAELKGIAQSLDDLCGQKTDDLADRIRALAASPPPREEAPADKLLEAAGLLNDCIWPDTDTGDYRVEHDGSVEKARAILAILQEQPQ